MSGGNDDDLDALMIMLYDALISLYPTQKQNN
jgi:hypothetical protein